MARLYANENFAFAVVQELRALGHDVTTVQDSGLANRSMPDCEILRYATSLGAGLHCGCDSPEEIGLLFLDGR